MSEHQDKLSIIIVSFNEAPHIARLKKSIDHLAPPCPLQVETILIDGGSTDGTVEQARACGFSNIVELPKASIPVCRNRGLEEANGNWIAFIDADCELHPDWLKAAVTFLHQPEPFLLGWPVVPPVPGTWVQRAWHIHWSNKNPHTETMLNQRVVTREAFRLITTRNLLMNREVLDTVPSFDENLPTGEDTDFVFRATQRNIRVIGLPTLKVIHHGEPETLSAFFKQQLWHANRKSYATIYRETGGKSGGNAPRFTMLFLAAFLVGFAGLVWTLLTANMWGLAALLPLAGLVGLPASAISLRAGKPVAGPQLAVLYFAYGLARSLDLLGFHRIKTSWKS